MNFEEARAEYERLRRGYDAGAMAPGEYARRVQALQVRDAGGGYWAIDGATGGWLRYDYDHRAWVPGQPPAPAGYGSQPHSAGAYAPQSPGYPYAPSPQAAALAQTPAAPATTETRPRRRALLAGCLAVATVLLLACAGLGTFALLNGAFDRETGITAAGTAGGLDAANKPATPTDQFTPGSTVYITYTAKRMQPGQEVRIKLFRNDAPVTLTADRETFEEEATYDGAFQYEPRERGNYRAELYLDGQPSPSQTVTFTVR